MAIATLTNKALYIGNGATTVFSAPFLFYDNAELQVSLVDTTTGVQTMQTEGTHYSVSGVGVGSGGSVTFIVAPPGGNNVLIKRVIPATQLVDLKEGDKFPPETIEQSFDLLVMIAQQLSEVDTRCVKLPEGSLITDLTLPDISLASSRSKIIKINSSGDGFDLVSVASTDFANPLVAKGDMVVHDGVSASRLPVGADGSFLIANSPSAKGVKYVAPGANGKVLRANSNVTDKVAFESAFMTETFKGLVFRSHPDSDVALTKCLLEKCDLLVMNDGTQVTGLSNLVLDKTVVGAGGMQAAAVATTWNRAYVIRKSSDGTTALFAQRAKDYFLDVQQTGNDTSLVLRRTTAPTQTKISQSYQPVTAGPLVSLDIVLGRTGSPVGNVWMTIEADVAGAPSGTPLATSQKLDASKISTGGGYVKFLFRSPATLSAATSYWLVLQGDYATSDAVNNISWAGKATTNPYASGVESAFNSGAWVQTANLDMTFKAYVTRNDTVISLPTGYDQYAQIGWFFLNGSTQVNPFLAKDKYYRHFVTASVGSIGTTAPLMVDWSNGGLPPVPVLVDHIGQSTLIGNFAVTGVEEGYGATAASVLNAHVVSIPVANHLMSAGTIPTDYNTCYYIVSAGVGSAYVVGFWW